MVWHYIARWKTLKTLLLSIILLWGCTYYRPVPFTAKAIQKKLAVPAGDVIKIKASRISHPILRPVNFDMRDGLSPDEAAVLAIIANPSLKAIRNARNLASAQLLQAGILPNPHISYSFESPAGNNASDKVNAWSMKFDWNITSLVAREAHKSKARFNARSIDLTVAWQEWQVAERAKLHVYHIIMARKRLALARSKEQMAEYLYNILKKGISLGVKTREGLFSSRILLGDARTDLLQAQAILNSERLALKKVLGIPGNMDIRIEKNISLPSIDHVPQASKIIHNIKKSRLDLLALRYGYESQEEGLRAAILSRFPEINLGLKGGKDTDGIKTIGAEITMSFPVLDKNQGNIAMARATRQKLFDEYVARLFEAQSNIVRIIEEIHATRKQLKNTERIIGELKELAKYYRQAYDHGGISIIDYYKLLLQVNTREFDKLILQSKLIDLAVGLEIASGQYLFTGSRSDIN